MPVPDAHVLSVDLGAESGRVWSVRLDDGRLTSHEVQRFRNRPVRVGDTLHWDVLSLWQDVRDGLDGALADEGGPSPQALGIDAWAVDFGLLDRRGKLLGNPVHYRDARTRGMIERVAARVDRATIFAETGIQFLPINTIYQLAAMVEADDPQLDAAERLLLVPDLLHYWLTGRATSEYTNATTTQLYDAVEERWSPTLLGALDLPDTLFPEVVPPGTQLGAYRGVPVIAPATHDTGSAVAGLPVTSGNIAYVSSGTWSLVGTEVTTPVRSRAALDANVTNEGGVAGTTRLLKNVMGLWILQQCRDTWAREGTELTYAELVELAEQAPPLRSLVPVDHPDFLEPGDHPAIIARLCREHGEPVPEGPGAITRCVLESLALAYRRVLDVLAELTGRRFDVVHVVGGGSRNALLNRFTADAAGVPVVAGPPEATVLGNAAVQMMALGVFPDLATARRTIAASVQLDRVEPSGDDRWAEAATRFARLEAGA